jgi:hypothetical protein
MDTSTDFHSKFSEIKNWFKNTITIIL